MHYCNLACLWTNIHLEEIRSLNTIVIPDLLHFIFRNKWAQRLFISQMLRGIQQNVFSFSAPWKPTAKVLNCDAANTCTRLLHSTKNSRQTLANDDGHFRHQPQGDVEGVNNNETANWKACQEALKCHFQNVDHHMTEGGLDRCDDHDTVDTASLWLTKSHNSQQVILQEQIIAFTLVFNT